MSGLSRKEVEKLVERVKNEASKPQCLTCDCFQGFLVQLEMDCPENVGDIVTPLKVSKEKMHGCLGCVPCPAGELFCEYIRNTISRKD